MPKTQNLTVSVNKRLLKAASHDAPKSAEAANLIYVTPDQPGIERKKHGKAFSYYQGNKKIEDEITLHRINKLVLPPAWSKVWICKLENGHLQAIGIDALNRKQYRYHTLWNEIRKQTKFYRMQEFGKRLPLMREKIEKDLSLKGYPKEKVLALVVSLMAHTHIRIGNASYEKLYGSYGLTTLKNEHVDVQGTEMIFSFKGKKGVKHHISLHNKRLSKLVKGCQEIHGKDLFEYIDESGTVHDVDSGMVNDYIRQISGGEFTAKDFRTWAGTVHALLGFKDTGTFETGTEMKHKINSVLESVAKELGNTVTVCKKYYVHPVITKLYEEKKLDHYVAKIEVSSVEIKCGLAAEESALMYILEHCK